MNQELFKMNMEKRNKQLQNGLNNKIDFKKLLSRKELLITGIFFLAVLALLLYTFLSPNYYPSPGPVRIEITEGMPLSRIVDTLSVHHIIPSKTNFKIAVYIMGAEKRMKAGRYEIPNGLSYVKLIEYFVEGHGDLLKSVKIYDGLTIKKLAAAMQVDLKISSDEFYKMCYDRKLLDSLELTSAASFEGFLLPGTYGFYERSNPKEIICKMFKRFKSFVMDTLEHKSKFGSYSLYQRVIMASIVNGETNKASDMPIIAGVYYNRLSKGMKLQADPTVQYLLPKWKRLRLSDLKIKSPYNTYMYKGLPPAPISSPGKEALKAAYLPDKNNYLFFVADGKGNHKFASTFQQHTKNVEEYRKWQDSQEQ